ncbi:MAG: hypothetical protein IJB96_12075 [Lachnospira sp.]|nr:hypothetical protein [Lachnospira sp.]
MSDGLFGGLFDFNRDGELDRWEKAAEWEFCYGDGHGEVHDEFGFDEDEEDEDEGEEW